jgi:hypothetical protein
MLNQLRALWFLKYINDIDEVVESKTLKVAEVTWLFGVVANQQDKQRSQNDLKIYTNGL